MDKALLVALVVAGAIIYYRGLGSYPLIAWDEAIYANAAQHAVHRGHWLFPHVNWMVGSGQIREAAFLEKPPLALWVEAVSMLVFGTTAFGARFPSATATIAASVLIFFFGKELHGREVGYFSGLIFLVVPYICAGNNAGRTGGTDMLNTLLGAAFVYLVLKAVREDRSGLFPAVGLVGALTVLVKGFGAGIFAIAVLPLVFVNYRVFLTKDFVRGLGVGGAVLLPWPILAWATYGEQFIREIFIEQVLTRATESSMYTVEGAMFGFMKYPYFKNFLVHFDPWVYFLIPAALVTRDLSTDRDDMTSLTPLFLCWWGVSTMLFFVYTGNHQWYIIPAYVPFSLLVGWLFSLALRREPTAIVGVLVGTALTLLFSFRMAEFSPFAEPRTQHLLSGELVTGVQFLLGIAVVVGAILLFPTVKRIFTDGMSDGGYHIASNIVPVALAVFVVVAFVGAPPSLSKERMQEQKAAGNLVDSGVPAEERVYVGRHAVGSVHFTWAFYADHSLESIELSEVDGSVQYLVLHRDRVESLDRPYRKIGQRPLEDKTIVLVKLQNSS
ncbi:4-amino-4-deoxy-L-arabinose transferase [Halopelagius longus]|nr:4-amino-4-deoxy-L-arabinose transferase [Halopelagius longus]